MLNAPEAFRDSTMADYGIYKRMRKLFSDRGGKVVVNSTFNIGSRYFIIKFSQQDPTDDHALLVNRDAISVRQLSIWGMCVIQGLFPRLQDPLYYEEKGDRMVIISLMVYLHNFQTP